MKGHEMTELHAKTRRRPTGQAPPAPAGEEIPLKDGEVHKRRFDAKAQAEYLVLIRAGHRLGSAAVDIGFTAATVRAARKKDPAFDAAVWEAEEDAAEPIEAALRERAINGDMRAIELWLKTHKRQYEDKGGPAVQVNVGSDAIGLVQAGQADAAIASLKGRLQQRAIGEGPVEGGDDDVVEAELVEDSSPLESQPLPYV